MSNGDTSSSESRHDSPITGAIGIAHQPARFSRLTVGQFASCERTVRESHVTAFCDLSNDVNPLHLDDDFARRCGHESRIVHGMLPLSMISCLVGTQLPGPGALWLSQQVEFVTPVTLNDRLEARVTIESMSVATQVITLFTKVINLDNDATVLRGRAKVRLPNCDAEEARPRG